MSQLQNNDDDVCMYETSSVSNISKHFYNTGVRTKVFKNKEQGTVR